MEFKKTIYVNKDELEHIKTMLTKEPASADECFSENCTMSYTADFGNGFEMDIKVCGVKYIEGESNLPYTEAVLFYNGIAQEGYTDASDKFEDVWELEADGDTFIVEVKCVEEKENAFKIRYFNNDDKCVYREYVTPESFLKDVESEEDDAPKEEYVNVKVSFGGKDAEYGVEFDSIRDLVNYCKSIRKENTVFEVGQIVWCKNYESIRKKRPFEECIAKYKIMKVGKKYLTLRPYRHETHYSDIQVYKDTFIEKTDYSPNYMMYLSKHDILDELQYQQMACEVFEMIRNWPYVETIRQFDSYQEAINIIRKRKNFLQDVLNKIAQI